MRLLFVFVFLLGLVSCGGDNKMKIAPDKSDSTTKGDTIAPRAVVDPNVTETPSEKEKFKKVKKNKSDAFDVFLPKNNIVKSKKQTQSKRENTITWEEAKKYKKLSEEEFLKHKLFCKPDKTVIDSISRYRIIHRYYYKNKLAINGEKRHWVFSFDNGYCFGHGWAKKAFD